MKVKNARCRQEATHRFLVVKKFNSGRTKIAPVAHNSTPNVECTQKLHEKLLSVERAIAAAEIIFHMHMVVIVFLNYKRGAVLVCSLTFREPVSMRCLVKLLPVVIQIHF